MPEAVLDEPAELDIGEEDGLGMLFNKIPVKILLLLEQEGTLKKVEIARGVDGTKSHVSKTTDRLEEIGLVEIERIGRCANVSLTLTGGKFVARLGAALRLV